MVVELEVISLIPALETGKSAARYIPMRVYQKKVFNTEQMEIEECVDSKGWNNKKCSVAKYQNEYYKLKIPYSELSKYIKPIVIGGLDAKRTTHPNL